MAMSMLSSALPKLRPSAGVAARVTAFDASIDGVFAPMRGRSAPDRLFYVASALGDHGLLWHGIGALRGLRSDRDFTSAVRLSVALGIESAIVNGPVKSLFERRRPLFDGVRPHHLRQPLTSSFPSGHASAAFCAAVLLADGDPLGPLYYAAAGVVAASRVHVRIHHPSDVVVGAAVGIAIGHILNRVLPRGRPSRPGSAPS